MYVIGSTTNESCYLSQSMPIILTKYFLTLLDFPGAPRKSFILKK